MRTPTARRISAVSAALLLVAVSVVSAPPAAGADPPGTTVERTVVSGAQVHGANGLAIDHAGRLIVASVFGHELVALDATTGHVLERIGPYLGALDVGGPDDVAVGPDGSICWTDTMGGLVNCLRQDGSVVTSPFIDSVNPITFSDGGRLFVGQAFGGDGLYELDPVTLAPTLLWDGGGSMPWPEQLNGFDVGPDGMLYAPQPFSGTIVRFDVTSPPPLTPEVVWGGAPVGAVDFDPFGVLHAALPITGEVVRIDLGSGATTTVAQLDPNLDNMTFDAAGHLYVSNSHDGRVVRLLPGGQTRDLVPGGMILPGGIAAVRGGAGGGDRLLVADTWSLKTYDGRSGRLLGTEANSHIGESIVPPASVAVDGQNVIVTTWLLGSIVQVWDPVEHHEVAAWYDFNVPMNAIRFGDDLVVAELGSGSVVRETPDGVRSTIAVLAYPLGLAASGDDLWVGDWATGIVWQIVDDGMDVLVPVATGLSGPEGLAVDADGSLLVVEAAAGRLTRILPDGTLDMVADDLPVGAPAPDGLFPSWVFNGVAVGPSGTIYVTGDDPSVILSFTDVPMD